MPKTKIQFQKGMSLPHFNKLDGTHEQCQVTLFNYRWPHGFTCPKCGNTQYGKVGSRSLFQCSQCRRQTSLISGTVFASIKLPLTIRVLAICMITQSKKVFHHWVCPCQLGPQPIPLCE